MPGSGTNGHGLEARSGIGNMGELYRALVEHASDLITVVDGEGRFLFINSRAAHAFGFSPEDCGGRHALDFVHPDDVERTAAWLRGCIADRRPSGSIENRQVCSDGTVRTILWSSVFHYDAAGNLLRGDGAGRDMTGLRETQRELEDRVRLLEDAHSVSRLGYYFFDVGSATWVSSPILDEALGIDDSFVRDAPGWVSLVYPEDREMVAEVMRRDLQGEEGPMDSAYRIVRHSDGAVRWIHSLARLDRDTSGNVVRVIGTIMDITNKRLAEEELIRAKEESGKHSTLLEEVQSVANLGYYDYDVVSGFWTSSPIMDSIFGIDENYVRSLEGWLGIVHPNDQEMMGAYLGEMFARRGSFDRVYRVARVSDGETRWVHGLGRVTYDEAGTPLRMFGTISDITERKMLERELEHQRERVAKLALDVLDRSEHERHLLAAELHDGVTQVLVAAKMSASQLMQDCAGTPSADEAQRLGRLLGVAISDARSLTAELSHPVLRESGLGPALGWLASGHEERFGLKCVLEVDPRCHDMGDHSAVLLYRGIRELLNNVHKHSGADVAHVKVVHEGDAITALVEDEGQGFDATVATSPHQAGERFGLRNVREELELAEGMLFIETAPGRGTAIRIRIPVSISAD